MCGARSALFIPFFVITFFLVCTFINLFCLTGITLEKCYDATSCVANIMIKHSFKARICDTMCGNEKKHVCEIHWIITYKLFLPFKKQQVLTMLIACNKNFRAIHSLFRVSKQFVLFHWYHCHEKLFTTTFSLCREKRKYSRIFKYMLHNSIVPFWLANAFLSRKSKYARFPPWTWLNLTTLLRNHLSLNAILCSLKSFTIKYSACKLYWTVHTYALAEITLEVLKCIHN